MYAIAINPNRCDDKWPYEMRSYRKKTMKNHMSETDLLHTFWFVLIGLNWEWFISWIELVKFKNHFSMIIILFETNDANWKVKQQFGQLKVNYAIWKFVKNSLKICLFVSTDWIGWNFGCICMKWCRYWSKEKWVHIVLNEKITHFDVALVVDY